MEGIVTTYAERVQNGGISDAEAAYLLHEMEADFSRMAEKHSAGKKVMQAKNVLSLGKAITGMHKAMSCGVLMYFMGKPPTEEECRRWFQELYGHKVTLQKFHFVGKGFYQAVKCMGQRDGFCPFILRKRA